MSAGYDVDVCSTWIKVSSTFLNQENCCLKSYSKFRNPGDDEIIEMSTILPELRDRIVAAADVRIIDREE